MSKQQQKQKASPRTIDSKTKKLIVADYIQSGSYRATGRKFGISDNTVKKAVRDDPRAARLCAEKKARDEQDMLAFLDARKGKAIKIIDTYLDELLKPERLERMNAVSVATAMAIVIDKFTGSTAAAAATQNGVKVVIEGKIVDLTEGSEPDGNPV